MSTSQSLDNDPIFNEMTRAEATKLKNAVSGMLSLAVRPGGDMVLKTFLLICFLEHYPQLQ